MSIDFYSIGGKTAEDDANNFQFLPLRMHFEMNFMKIYFPLSWMNWPQLFLKLSSQSFLTLLQTYYNFIILIIKIRLP